MVDRSDAAADVRNGPKRRTLIRVARWVERSETHHGHPPTPLVGCRIRVHYSQADLKPTVVDRHLVTPVTERWWTGSTADPNTNDPAMDWL